MAEENLTLEECRRGAELVRELANAGFPIGFAGWLRDADDAGEPFRLYIATPLWDMDGPFETVSLVDRFFEMRGASLGFDIHDIEIGPSTADAMRQLREHIHMDVNQFLDVSELDEDEIERGGMRLNIQCVYISVPEAGRESIKAARRAFERKLADMEAA